MPVNLEVKGMLARLLATEDIVVEHKKVETACFNVHTRVLTLPMWEKASNNVYDLLVSHECGHSIFTDNIDWTKDNTIPPQFVNVVEDARIEKLMKRRYPGLAKTFYTGYKELYEQDFFAIEDEDVNSFNLADRANLYFKIGNFVKLNFNSEEQEIIDLISSADTFPQVLDAAEILYKYCKKEEQQMSSLQQLDDHKELPQKESGQDPSRQQSNQSENSAENSENFDFEKSDDNQSETGEVGDGLNDQTKSKVDENKPKEPENDPEVKTMESLEEALKDLVSHDTWENVYVEIPNLDLNSIVVSNSEIHNTCNKFWQDSESYNPKQQFKVVDKEYLEFKRSAQKEVNYLVKEFECRKAADSYARASTARTGVLDCARLHNYKFSEDLFKKVTVMADGKNHGLIFILDWSGSMGEVMLDTVKQLFNLVWFCKKVSIPFEVYAFTTDYPVTTYVDGKPSLRTPAYKKKEGVFYITEWFSMMNLLTSKVNGNTLDNQMKNIFRIARAFGLSYGVSYNVPTGLSLSGTPLNEAMMSLHQILPKFQKENKLQKVQCVILTDGEGSYMKYHKEFNRKWEKDPYVGTCSIGMGTFLRDRKTGNTYSLDADWCKTTDVLLKNLRDKFQDANFIGIRVLQSRDSGNFIRRYYDVTTPEYNKVMDDWKKNRAFSIKTSGYQTYFGLSANALSQDSEFDVHECASKSQIKSAFMKSFRAKKMNKKILSEFIDLVA